jgi:hypothetical protein
MDWTAPSCVAGHEASRQVAAKLPMAAWVGPHWQAGSLRAQPARVMAEAMQAVAQGGSEPRFWAVVRVRRVVMARIWSFMVAVVFDWAGCSNWLCLYSVKGVKLVCCYC